MAPFSERDAARVRKRHSGAASSANPNHANDGAAWWGSAFEDVTQTGVRFTLPFKSPAKVIEVVPPLDSNYANSGEILADGTTGSEVASALMATPGYEVELNSSDTITIHTSVGAEYGFTSLFNIYGARRIRGGGVFKLVFNQNLNLRNINIGLIVVEAEYGRGNQYIAGTLLVPQK